MSTPTPPGGDPDPRSPWAPPPTGSGGSGGWTAPGGKPAGPPPPAGPPYTRPVHGAPGPATTGPTTQPFPAYPSGGNPYGWTGRQGSGPARPDVIDGGPPERDHSARNRTVLGFAVGGGVLLVLGLVLVLVLAGTGFFGAGEKPSLGPVGGAPTPSSPPLARLCPAPSNTAEPGRTPQPPAAGPRVVDADAGISYVRLGSPWRPWDQGTWSSGTLGVRFAVGYYFVTETYSQGEFLASVLSGKVPATVGDSLSLNLECAGRQVAEDVRRSYYPQPTRKEQVRDERVILGGRPAWVSTFHLTFSADGLSAKGEQAAVVLVDVGRPDAAVLYISIPDTHRQYRPEIDRIIASVQPT